MEFGREVSRPAVIMMVEGRVPLGGQEALERFYAEVERYFHDLKSMVMRLQWDSDDPHRFRALFEYETERDFETDDIRSRVDPATMALRSRLESLLEGLPEVSIWRESSRQFSADLVRAYWGLVDAREWEALRAIIADDIVMEWPAFNERIIGADNVIAANAAAPEHWVAKVNWVVASGDHVASSVEVLLGTGMKYVLGTYWTVRHQRILRATEHWCPYGVSEAPAWRRKFAEPMDVSR